MYFKILSSVIISKPNKALYDFPKMFRLIVLLNMLGKLIKKVIGERLQFQLSRLKQWFTIDAEVVLTHITCAGWVKNLSTSTLVFDITQFFPSLNHQLLPLILNKARFYFKIS